MTARKTNTNTEVEVGVGTAAEVASTVPYPTTEQLIKDGMTTKSARIRHLHSLGMAIGDIARQETGGLYQHAYNVIKKPLKRKEGGSTDSKPTKPEVASKEQEKVTAV